MALTGTTERADKISGFLARHVKDGVEALRRGALVSYSTPPLYKQRGGIAESFITVSKNTAGEWVACRTVSNPGKIPQDYTSIIKPTPTKSAGSRIEQEILKKITKKLRDAWSETPAGASSTSVTELKKVCTLHKWEKHAHKMPYPCIVQPKIDGVRCYWDGTLHKLFSRSGKEYIMPDITDILKLYWDGIDLDGELAYADWTVPMPEVVHGVSHQYDTIVFHIFDAPDTGSDFRNRFIAHLPMWVKITTGTDRLSIVETKVCDRKMEVEAFHKQCTDKGMEGVVVRDPNTGSVYGKRVYDILKFKQEWEEDFKIDSYFTDPHPKGGLIVFRCRKGGVEFKVVPAWTHDDRRLAIGKDWQGIAMTVEYRSKSKDDIPIHAVGRTSYKKMLGKL